MAVMLDTAQKQEARSGCSESSMRQQSVISVIIQNSTQLNSVIAQVGIKHLTKLCNKQFRIMVYSSREVPECCLGIRGGTDFFFNNLSQP